MSTALTPPYPLTTVVIDGATGAGRLVGIRLAAAGAVLAIATAAGSSPAAYLTKELVELGLTALPYQVDPFDPRSVQELVTDIVQDLGPIDVLIDLVPAQPGRPAPNLVSQAVLDAMNTSGRTGRIILLPGTATALADGGSPNIVIDVVPLPDAGGLSQAAANQQLSDSVLSLLGLSPDHSGPDGPSADD